MYTEESPKSGIKEKLRGLVGSTKDVISNSYTSVMNKFSSSRKDKSSEADTVQTPMMDSTDGSAPQDMSPQESSSDSAEVGSSVGSTTAISRLLANKKTILTAVVALAVIAGIGFSVFYFFIGDDKQGIKEKKAEVFTIIKEGEVIGTYSVGEQVRFGDLQFSVHNIVEDSYKTLETDFNGKRMTKAYLGLQIEVFNMSHNTNDILYFGLTDADGNQYERDREIEFYLGSTKDFGIAKEIYPRSIREGYLLFPAPNKDVKDLQLIVFSDVRKEKIVFEIER